MADLQEINRCIFFNFAKGRDTAVLMTPHHLTHPTFRKMAKHKLPAKSQPPLPNATSFIDTNCELKTTTQQEKVG
eukprot:scaffold5119_cov153-Skeletonema_dohrnii-CCMP3373.AAC.7